MPENLQQGFQLGEFTIHPLRGTASGPDGVHHVPPMAMGVLLCLAKSPGTVVTRRALLSEVWGDSSGSGEALTHCVSELRHQFGDRRELPTYIQTLPKRGYRLVAPIADVPTSDFAPTAHHLAAIMFTDIVGYTAAMGESEAWGMRLRRTHRNVVKTQVRRYGGEWIDETGDETLSCFPSATNAVNCALAIQELLRDSAELTLRIGIHLGDVMKQEGRLYGDGVNVAAHIRQLAGPGEIFISEEVQHSVHNQPNIETRSSGLHDLKNIPRPVPIFAVTGKAAVPRSGEARVLRVKPAAQRWVAFAAVVVAVAAWGLLHWGRGELLPAHVPDRSIAVLPFVNMSDDSSNEYFSDGLSEEILNSLTRLKELKVAARTSSFYFKDKDVDISTIALHLGVRHVLEGSVRRQGQQVRVTAQLIRADTGFHAWSEIYDRDIKDIFGIQSDIARNVVKALELVLSSESGAQLDRQATASLDAYEYFLQGRSYLRNPEDESTLASAETLFEKALAIDVDFAEAYAGLCDTYLIGYERTRSVKLFEKAEHACHRALTLDSTAGCVYTALGNLYRNSGQYHKAEQNFERAIALNTSAVDAYDGLAETYEQQNRLDEAESTFRRAIEIQPRFWRGHLVMGNFLFSVGRSAEAVEYFLRVTDLTPDNSLGYLSLGSAYYMLGEYENAAIAWRRSVELSPSHIAYSNIGVSYFFLGRFQEAIEMYQRATELAPDDYQTWGDLGDACRFAEGRTELETSAYKKAIELAENVLRLNPSDANATALLAHYYANLGESERARQLIARALKLSPQSMYVCYDAAVTNVSLGEADEALAAIERAVELGYPVELLSVDAGLAPLMETDRFRALIAKRED